MGKQFIKYQFVFNNYSIPVYHYKEYRASIRFSITKKGLVIRSPIFSKTETVKVNAEDWCKNLLIAKPAAIAAFKIKNYKSGDSITLLGQLFILKIEESKNEKYKISWANNLLTIQVPFSSKTINQNKVIQELLAKFAAKRFLHSISERVHYLNDKHFQEEISNIRLKNNHSNWGSCSSKGNINLSVKLLFAPQEVVDYVIIHELAHRRELNHSARFWNHVKIACPDYKTHEKWLKNNSDLCHF